jgi:hypothetical protein
LWKTDDWAGPTGRARIRAQSIKPVCGFAANSQTLDASSQYLYGSGGQRFDADSEASIYLEESKTFLEDINPGNAVNGIVVFDIPKNEKPTKIELHDSSFSGGVTVEL